MVFDSELDVLYNKREVVYKNKRGVSGLMVLVYLDKVRFLM